MSPIQPKKQTKPSRKKLCRALLTTTLLLGTQGLYGIGAQAAIAPAGQIIQNKATGSFVDTDNTEKAIQSNVVQVTVAEVTGITVDPLGVTGTPYLGNTIYFDFTVTNIGNDPTQFFIPSAPSSITGGTAGTIQIIAYDPDGSGPTAPTTLAVNVPASSATGSMSGNAAFNNGSIPAGGTITVRVPVTVTATGNNPVTVTLGNTPVAPNNQNQDFIIGTNDLYTVDNSGTTNGDLVSGDPFNGDATTHRKEASATLSATAIPNITGTVFEDVNYGGGAGRPFGTAGTVGRIGATVELYKSDGTYITSTTTIAGGAYTFTNVTANADYIVRVVNSTVSSSRSGAISGLLPVQTFRTDAATGTALSVADHVGGEKPAEEDAPARSGSQTLAALSALLNKEVQSVTTVKVGSTDTTAVDFGYNFDTIVNTNDSGQGSLRQFITNANALGGEATLAQSGNRKDLSNINQALPAGQESSIFMISDGAAHPGLSAGLTNQLTSGVGIITPTTLLPSIIGTNANNTVIDGTTQTVNIGDANSGQLGTGGLVGTGADGVVGTGDEPTLSQVYKPEIQIVGTSSLSTGLFLQSNNDTVRGIAIYGFGGANVGQIQVDATGSSLTQISNPTIESSIVGTTASSFSATGVVAPARAFGISFRNTSGGLIQNNLIGYNPATGLYVGTGTQNPTITNNEFRGNNTLNNNVDDGLGFQFGSGATVTGNLSIANGAVGMDVIGYNGSLFENNTISGNGVSPAGNTETPGMRLYSSNTDIKHNIISSNYGAGILVEPGNINNKISQNSIFGNGTIVNNAGAAASGQIGIDILSSTDNQNQGTSTYVTPNNGTVSGSGNQAMNYPIITSSTLSGSTLTLKGFVGKVATGSSAFAGAKLEFFISEGTDENKGEVILGDGKNLPHGEGKTYLGSCIADANGLFGTASKPCVLNNVPGTLNPRNITTTATDSNGNTSEFSATAVNNPNLLLVKRITAIKRKGTSSFVSNTTYTDDPSYAYDDNDLTVPAPATPSDPPEDTDKWPDPTLYLQGLIDGGAVNPGDEVEFTIYFLSTGVTSAKSMALCDVLPKNMTFVADSFNGSSPTDTGSLPGENLGIAIANDATTLPSAPTIYLTNIGGDDQAQFIPPGSVPPVVCKDPSNLSIGLTAATNTTGAIYLQLRNNLPPATAQGMPTNSYGFVRFRAKVN